MTTKEIGMSDKDNGDDKGIFFYLEMKNYYKRGTKGISRYYQSSENDTLKKTFCPKIFATRRGQRMKGNT